MYLLSFRNLLELGGGGVRSLHHFWGPQILTSLNASISCLFGETLNMKYDVFSFCLALNYPSAST